MSTASVPVVSQAANAALVLAGAAWLLGVTSGGSVRAAVRWYCGAGSNSVAGAAWPPSLTAAASAIGGQLWRWAQRAV